MGIIVSLFLYAYLITYKTAAIGHASLIFNVLQFVLDVFKFFLVGGRGCSSLMGNYSVMSYKQHKSRQAIYRGLYFRPLCFILNDYYVNIYINKDCTSCSLKYMLRLAITWSGITCICYTNTIEYYIALPEDESCIKFQIL